jgi:hypothetical protein
MGLNRILSLIIAVGYIIAAILTSQSGNVVIVVAGIIFALALIWFGDEIGGFTGLSGSGISITRTSPGCAIIFLGWVFLLSPLIIWIITYVLG